MSTDYVVVLRLSRVKRRLFVDVVFSRVTEVDTFREGRSNYFGE